MKKVNLDHLLKNTFKLDFDVLPFKFSREFSFDFIFWKLEYRYLFVYFNNFKLSARTDATMEI